ncbi:DUF1697 domain-containing protein [Haloferula sp. BvORR071]|uniref:DUF1697 domain-containing protein n=1 Tax=Haloferula sp. BvORR071 TaxID=1396141 RepID=UPI00054F128B|nr:DUF1697 domain-containing protein [Haloferula sp. BvORR071]
MSTYLALLRGINVSGKNMLRMPALQALLADLGCENVRTYLQSGNAVFDAKKTTPAKLASMIEASLKKDHGVDSPVLVLPAKDLDAIATDNPLLPKSGDIEETHYHATFLFEPVTEKAFEALKLPAAEGERAAWLKGAILLHCPHGYGNTKLNNNWFERALKVKATTRNWRSVLALRKMCQET